MNQAPDKTATNENEENAWKLFAALVMTFVRLFSLSFRLVSAVLRQMQDIVRFVYTRTARLLFLTSKWTKELFGGESVTISIEDSEIRFMAVKGKSVKRWGSEPLEAGVVKDGLVLDSESLNATIAGLILSRKLKKGSITTSLSGTHSVHRTIEIPRVPGRLVAEAILSETKRVMPISLEQLYLSWQIVSQTRDTMRVFVLGTPRSLLDAEVMALRQSRLKPGSMNLKPIALSRMVNRSEALIIDIEPHGCEIIVVVAGIPTIMRSIPVHSEYGPLNRSEQVLHEFERTLRFYESNYPDRALDPETPLFLTGSLAGDEELCQTVSSGTGFKITALESPLKNPPDFPVFQYAVNLGLALKSLSPYSKKEFLVTELDILPEAYLPHRASGKKVACAFGIIAGLALIYPLYQVAHTASVEEERLRNQYNVLYQSTTLRQAQVREGQKIQSAIGSANARGDDLIKISEAFRGIVAQRQLAYDSLGLAIRAAPFGLLPGNVSLISIAQDSTKLTLVGTASNYEAALQYADALRKTEGFSNVQVASMARTGDNSDAVGFSLSLRWRQPG